MIMKRISELKMITFVLALSVVSMLIPSCDKNEDSVKLYEVSVALEYPVSYEAYAGAPVTLRDVNVGTVYDAETDEKGIATFKVPSGVYEAMTSDAKDVDEMSFIFNGVSAQIVAEKVGSSPITISVKVSAFNREKALIIKEIYNGGVTKDNGEDSFAMDKCIILYNNSPKEITVDNLAVGMSAYYNAEAAAMSKIYNNGKLIYEDENFIPAMNGIWYFQAPLTIPAFTQVVVNCMGAIDNTLTVSNSVNYANADYYTMYDPEYKGAGTNESNMYYNNTSYYPAPADVIPTSHYLKTVKVGQSSGWPLSATSPAIFIYQTEGVTPKDYAENVDNLWYYPGYAQSATWGCTKVPNEWILDGVEVWSTPKIADSKKRFTADIDAGYVALTNKLGHVLYRNVDVDRTEALPENNGKLVYNYSLAVDDANNGEAVIDAEASMKNGAHIVFMDTNNSTNDFHERLKCSLRGE